MSGKLPLLAAMVVALGVGAARAVAADAINPPLPTLAASLEFLDGSLLLGSLQSLDAQNGIRWKHPATKAPIEFALTNVHQIRFTTAARSTGTNAPMTCRLRFANGDEVSGELVALDEGSVEINTWFAGRLRAARSALTAIAVAGPGNAVLYEGPDAADGWKFSGSVMMGGRVFGGGFGGPVIIENGVVIQGGGAAARGGATNVWQVRNRALVGSGSGTAGREFNLPPVARIEFDLAWRQSPTMRFAVCTDVVDRMDYSSGYQFYIANSYVYLYRRSGADGGQVFAANENARIPQMAMRNRVHLEFRVNKEKETVALLADGQPVKTWRVTGPQPEGNGLLFISQRTDSTLRISNLRVSAWDGRDQLAAPTNSFTEPILHLANTDRVTGKIEGVRNGKLALVTEAGRLDIPLQRTAHIFFPMATNPPPAADSAAARLTTTRGDSLLLTLEKWNDTEATGTSANFGKVIVTPQSVRQILFNPFRPREDSTTWDDALFGRD